MTVAAIAQFADKRMIEIAAREHRVVSQQPRGLGQILIEGPPMPACLFPAILSRRAGSVPPAWH